MRPTITHQIKPNIVSLPLSCDWNDVPGGKIRGPQSSAYPRPMRGFLHNLSCNPIKLFLGPRHSGLFFPYSRLPGLASALLGAKSPVRAELQLASVLTDHANLQRDVPIHAWGQDSPTEKITVTFHGQSITVTASSVGLMGGLAQTRGGRGSLSPWSSTAAPNLPVLTCWWATCGLPPGNPTWKCRLPDFPPSAHVTNAEQEIAQADLPQVRLLRVEHQSSAFPSPAFSAAWQHVLPRDRQRLLGRRLLFRPRDQPARTHSHRGDRLLLGRHADRLLDQPRRTFCRPLAHARFRCTCPFR